MLPLARNENLTVEHLPDETLIYDRSNGKAHCLNRTAAFVWKHCDGQTSVRDLARRLQRESGAPANEALVELALEQLRRRNLLAASAAPARDSRRLGRREVLRGLTAAVLPLVMTLTAKGQAAGQSTTTTTTTTTTTKEPTSPCVSGRPCASNIVCTPGTCLGGFCSC